MSDQNNGYTAYAPYGHPYISSSSQQPYASSSSSAPTAPTVPPVPPAPMQGQPNLHYAVVTIDISPLSYKERVWTLARTVKWIAAIDVVFSLFYAFLFWPYIFATLLSVCGYYGVKNYKRNYLICYMVYQVLNIGFRAYVTLLQKNGLTIFLSVLFIMFECYIFTLTYTLFKNIKKLTSDQLFELQNGWRPQRTQQIAFY